MGCINNEQQLSNDMNNMNLSSPASTCTKKTDHKVQEQIVTPWEVHGEVIDGVSNAINYDKLTDQFGCQPITPELIVRFERITGKKAHLLIRRGIFFAHRDLDRILTLYEAGKPFYLYTGRGPSSESMHLGHLIPFVFCKYLQDTFDVPLVIQMTDDEKFLFKDITLEQAHYYAFENAKDIVAVGFNPSKTFIFSDLDYYGNMLDVTFKIQKCINFNQARSVFGFVESDSIGQVAFPATEISPCFSLSFRHMFGGRTDVPCLIPAAIDQDPYFRLARDVAARLKFEKPSSLYAKFLPALKGVDGKMSASDENSAIYMTDSPKQIKDKINKYAFSGGGDTIELHREKGGNPDVDISYQYLRYLLDDDDELKRIHDEYKAGRMLTGEIKAKCIQVLEKFVGDFQIQRAAVTDATLETFMYVPEKPKFPKNK